MMFGKTKLELKVGIFVFTAPNAALLHFGQFSFVSPSTIKYSSSYVHVACTTFGCL